MLKKFKPTWCLQSVYCLTPTMLAEKKIKAILVDLDNTLVAWHEPNGTPALREWLQTMAAAGIPVIIVSNNNAKRVSKVADALQIAFVANAMKPTKKGLKKALAMANTTVAETVMIGDQVLTDILAGNRLGVATILVKPLVSSDMFATKMNRFFEKHILNYLKKKDSTIEWRQTLD